MANVPNPKPTPPDKLETISSKLPEKKTRADVQQLKSKWISNPNWKLSETKGFEHYKEELILFEEEVEANREAEREKAVERSAENLFETAFAQAVESLNVDLNLDESNVFALSSIAYSLLGITKQLDYIREELEKARIIT